MRQSQLSFSFFVSFLNRCSDNPRATTAKRIEQTIAGIADKNMSQGSSVTNATKRRHTHLAFDSFISSVDRKGDARRVARQRYSELSSPALFDFLSFKVYGPKITGRA